MFLVALWMLLVLVQGDYKYVYTVNLLPTSNPGGAVRVGDAVTIKWSGQSPSTNASLQVQLSLIDVPRWTSLGSIAPPVAQSSRIFKWIVPALTKCPRLYQIYIADIASTYGYGYSSSFNVSCAPLPPPSPSTSPLCYEQLRDIAVLKDNVPMSRFANLTRVQAFRYNNPTQVPSFVAVPRNVSEVQRVLACAAEAGIQVAIKGGGHSYAGFSQVAPHAIDSFLLSFSEMKEVSMVQVLDANTSLVKVSAGALFQDVFDFLNRSSPALEYDDLVIPGGLCPTVGVAGFMLGGGIGAISRTHGLGIDNIVSMEMVTADGSSVVTASSSQEKDLFWALRGGGQANMGVVTSFVIQLKDGRESWTYGVHCIGDRTQMTVSLNNFVNFVNTHSDFDRGLTVHWRVTTYNASNPPSGLCYYVYSTLGVNATSSALEDALSLSTTGGNWTVELKLKKSFLEMEHDNAQVKRYDQFNAGPMVTRNCVVPSMSAALATHILAMYDNITNQSAPCYVQGLAAGGQINAVQSNATAFPFRNGSAYYSDAECDFDESALTGSKSLSGVTTIVNSWLTRLIRSGLCQGSYQNFPFEELDPVVGFDFKTFYWKDNLPKLQQQRLIWNPWINNTISFAQQVPLPNLAAMSLPPELLTASRAAGSQPFHSLILSLALILAALFT